MKGQQRTGMANIGNTCFLNVTIQALRYTKPLAEYFCSDSWKKHRHANRKGYDMAQQFSEIFTILCTEAANRTVVPSKFVQAFFSFAKESNFEDIQQGGQADAPEAIQLLLDGLHIQQSREVEMTIAGKANTQDEAELIKSLESWSTFFRKEYSPIVDIFFGQTQMRVVCESCNHTHTRYEPWELLKAPIPGAEKQGSPAPTLMECIAATFNTEKLDDYVCDTCKQKNTTRIEPRISRFPDHMILSLKRFTNTGSKVRAKITYDENLVDLSQWIAWPSLQRKDSAMYRVYAVIDHMGGFRGGHYMMRARDDNGSQSEWLMYDDASCTNTPLNGSPTPDTYVIFLEKIKGSK